MSLAVNGDRWSRRRVAFALAFLLAAMFWALLHSLIGGSLTEFEERVGDYSWRLTSDRSEERRLVIVDIDERSLGEVGPWPWPRPLQAKLADQLAAAGVQQQTYDIVFGGPRPNDDMLAGALRRYPTVLAQIFAMEPGVQPTDGQLAGALDWPACSAPFDTATGYLANVPALA